MDVGVFVFPHGRSLILIDRIGRVVVHSALAPQHHHHLVSASSTTLHCQFATRPQLFRSVVGCDNCE